MTDERISYKDQLFDKAVKEATPHLVIVSNILTKYFKTLFENAGIEWTAENDEDINQLIINFAEANRIITFSTIGQVVMDLEKMRKK